MAGNSLPAGGPGVVKSFRSVLTAGPPRPAKIPVSYGEMNGMPAVFIEDEDMLALAKPFDLTLIGKFVVDRPSVVEIRRFVVRMKFFAFVKVDIHDSRNVVFRFSDARDYMRFFARRNFTILGIHMRVTKWSPFKDVSDEIPIVPLWVAFPGLRYQLYHLETLMDIAAVFGKPLCVDSNTASQNSMAKARVLVEVDVSRDHPKWVWLGSQDNGAPQPAEIENLPLFCAGCKKVGHAVNECQVSGKDGVGDAPCKNMQAAPLLQWVPKKISRGPGTEGTPSNPGGEYNHPGALPDANFSNYAAYAEKFLEEEALKNASVPIRESTPSPNISPKAVSHVISPVDDAGMSAPQAPPLVEKEGDVGSAIVRSSAISSSPGPISVIISEILGDHVDGLVSGASCREPQGPLSDSNTPHQLATSSASDQSSPKRSSVNVKYGSGVLIRPEEFPSMSGQKVLLSPGKGTPPPLPPKSNGKGKLLFSNKLQQGAKSSPPLSPRKTRSQAKMGTLGGDRDSWALSSKGSDGSIGPKSVVLDALLNPTFSNV